ncbi:MAG: M23 family metallopeptidase [Thermoanaerobaculales bacterium]|jgi:murein DD-endopeptidase MepM/ murein hydrolase activator NlpD|nr:M23 family metallopeptidase [Thermoanaerobaculales bacterium]
MTKHRPTAFAALLGTLLMTVFQGCASSKPATSTSSVPSGWPVDRSLVVVTREFGSPRGGSRHQGIDLAAPAGTAVHATADGRVVVAGREKRYGRMVLVDHGGGTLTRYAHLKQIDVARGDRVRRGDGIGRVGASGNASGPHLHYEVIRSGVPVNPRGYLGG